MRSLRALTKNTAIPAHGLNKVVALLILLPLALVEFCILIYVIAYGFRALGVFWFIASLWNLAICIALTVHIFKHKKVQADGYMEVSNYLNLNKLGRDKH